MINISVPNHKKIMLINADLVDTTIQIQQLQQIG